MLLEGV